MNDKVLLGRLYALREQLDTVIAGVEEEEQPPEIQGPGTMGSGTESIVKKILAS